MYVCIISVLAIRGTVLTLWLMYSRPKSSVKWIKGKKHKRFYFPFLSFEFSKEQFVQSHSESPEKSLQVRPPSSHRSSRRKLRHRYLFFCACDKFGAQSRSFTVNTTRANGGKTHQPSSRHAKQRETPDGPRTTVWVTPRRGETAWPYRRSCQNPRPDLVKVCQNHQRPSKTNSPCPSWRARQQRATTRANFIFVVFVVVHSQYEKQSGGTGVRLELPLTSEWERRTETPRISSSTLYRCVTVSFGASSEESKAKWVHILEFIKKKIFF